MGGRGMIRMSSDLPSDSVYPQLKGYATTKMAVEDQVISSIIQFPNLESISSYTCELEKSVQSQVHQLKKQENSQRNRVKQYPAFGAEYTEFAEILNGGM